MGNDAGRVCYDLPDDCGALLMAKVEVIDRKTQEVVSTSDNLPLWQAEMLSASIEITVDTTRYRVFVSEDLTTEDGN